ncbi:MAG: nucleotide exchange factor GrpE [Patescibacteria group bacterium]|nr:nucleotide exchange factor GrpE [Patescibacteria group bacterium]
MSEEKKDKNIDKKKKKEHKEVKEFESRYKRALADYQNLLRQTAKEKEEFAKYANMNFIMEILPVVDNFKISVEHIPEDQKEGAWVQGIIYIKKQLLDILAANGIEEVKTIGEKFNPEIHEAVEDKNCDKKNKENKKDIITKEILSGYKMNGKTIRAAKVIVD